MLSNENEHFELCKTKAEAVKYAKSEASKYDEVFIYELVADVVMPERVEPEPVVTWL